LNNHGRRALITACAISLGWCAPWRNWNTTFSGLTFTTTVWVIYWVHGNTTNRWTNSAPTGCSRFADLPQTMFLIANFTNGSAALNQYPAYFTRTKSNLTINTLARQ
jgi:hypothetical protein